MENVIDPLDGLSHQLPIQNGAMKKPMFNSLKVLLVARAEIIQDSDLGFALEIFSNVAADKPGASGDKYFQNRLLGGYLGEAYKRGAGLG